MEIDSEEHDAPRDACFSTPNVQYSNDQDKSVVPVDRLRDVAVIDEHQADTFSLT